MSCLDVIKVVTKPDYFLCIRVKGLNNQKKGVFLMKDKQIVDLYWARSETAISETDKKYGRYFFYIAHNILLNEEDSKECVNDTYLKAWEVMPPNCPNRLAVFLGKITRNISLNRYKYNHAHKRNGEQMPLVLDELHDCIPSQECVDKVVDDLALVEVFNRFLAELPAEARKIFLRRYWYLSSIKEIARDYSFTESKVKMSLFRSRNELKLLLEREGIAL